MNTVTRVGLIGLGAMGKGMAQSLRRAGHAPHVFDMRSEAAQAFASDGGIACGIGRCTVTSAAPPMGYRPP